ELAEGPVEQAGRARVGVLDAGGGDHDQEEEGEQQEEDGHSNASLGPSRHWVHIRLLAAPRLLQPNGASSGPDRPLRPLPTSAPPRPRSTVASYDPPLCSGAASERRLRAASRARSAAVS